MSSSRVIRLDLAYDGTGFRGWAVQGDPSVRTVQGVLTQTLVEMVREPVRLVVAGRTDAGVHARGQVASFRTGSGRTPGQIQAFVNGRLGPEVSIREASVAPEGFDARHSASAREYRYAIDTSAVPDPFSGRYVWHRPGALSVPAMRSAAAALVGEHDFASFCRHPGAGHSTVRDLQRLTVRREQDLVLISLRANAFLHQMVRVIVGTLVLVGQGRLAGDVVGRTLASRRRLALAKPAPARGLTLERVYYRRHRRTSTAPSRPT